MGCGGSKEDSRSKYMGSSASARPETGTSGRAGSSRNLDAGKTPARKPIKSSGKQRSKGFLGKGPDNGPQIVDTRALDEIVAGKLSSQCPPSQLFGVLSKTMIVMKRKAQEARVAAAKKHKGPRRQNTMELYRGEQEMSLADGMKLLDQRIAHAGLKTVVMGDDGNCQFRSFSHQLFRTEDHHEYVRKQAIAQMKRDSGFYGMYFDGDADFKGYLSRMSRSREWGDELTLHAIADAFGVHINVVSSVKEYWYLNYSPAVKKLEKQLFVSYISPIHYNSIVDIDE